MTVLVLALAAVVGLSIGLVARRIVDRRRRRRALIEKPRSLDPVNFYQCTQRNPVLESRDRGRHESEDDRYDTEIVIDLTRQPAEAEGAGSETALEPYGESRRAETGP